MGEHLPDSYTYFYASHDKERNVSLFRIKEILDGPGATDWVRKYSLLSKTTWRVSKTYPKIGRFNIYKVEYRCVHSTDRRAKGTGPSKHTGCEAKVQLTIKRFVIKTKKQKPDTLIKDFPCIVMIKSTHNHDLDSPSILKHRDLAPEIREKFVELHKAGHSPSAALLIHKTDLKIQFKDKYKDIEFDGQYMPTHSVIYKLFKKLSPDRPVRKKRLGKKPKEVSLVDQPAEVSIEVQPNHDAAAHIDVDVHSHTRAATETALPSISELVPSRGMAMTTEVQQENPNHPIYPENTDPSRGMTVAIDVPQEDTPTYPDSNIHSDLEPSHHRPVDKNLALTDAEQQQFYDLFQRIQTGLDNNASLFVPAVRSLLQNEKKYATTDTDLLRALHLFGNFSSVRKMSADNVARRTRKRQSQKSVESPKKTRKVCASVPQNTLYHCLDNNHPQEYHNQEYPPRPSQNYNLTYQVNYSSFYNM